MRVHSTGSARSGRLKMLVAAVCAVGATGLTAGTASAADSETASTQAEAKSARDVARSVASEQVHGPLYGKYKGKYSKKLDWSNNGCSVPDAIEDIKGIGAIIGEYGDFWQNSCDRHDFGYRNDQVHDYSRKSVDQKFRDNMKHQCDVDDAPGFPEPAAEYACEKAADAFYGAVRIGGGGSW